MTRDVAVPADRSVSALLDSDLVDELHTAVAELNESLDGTYPPALDRLISRVYASDPRPLNTRRLERTS